jgi:MFS superfamily sulfate permease-like transporter
VSSVAVFLLAARRILDKYFDARDKASHVLAFFVFLITVLVSVFVPPPISIYFYIFVSCVYLLAFILKLFFTVRDFVGRLQKRS